MAVYLVRHTAPAIDKGVCYGQADLDVKESFYDEANIIRTHLPLHPAFIYSSPLQRCSKLARHLFPDRHIEHVPDLMEIHCGEWELQRWNEIPQDLLDPWMKDFVSVRTPGGESYSDLFARTTGWLEAMEDVDGDVIVFTHGGVIRSLLSHLTDTALIDSFNKFSLRYGCVVKIERERKAFEILSNIPTEEETHKPT